jgi:ANTAR domain
MDDQDPDRDSEAQRQVEQLSARVAANRADIDALQARADAVDHRGDASEVRADASEARADDDRARIGRLEDRLDIDEKIIAELQAEGLLRQEETAHLREALRTSRMIGSAVGIVMANRKVTAEAAFEILVKASKHTNRKLRIIAEDVVRTGDVSELASS